MTAGISFFVFSSLPMIQRATIVCSSGVHVCQQTCMWDWCTNKQNKQTPLVILLLQFLHIVFVSGVGCHCWSQCDLSGRGSIMTMAIHRILLVVLIMVLLGWHTHDWFWDRRRVQKHFQKKKNPKRTNTFLFYFLFSSYEDHWKKTNGTPKRPPRFFLFGSQSSRFAV